MISGLTYSASKGKAQELHERDDLETQRLAVNNNTIAMQMAVQTVKVQQAQPLLALKKQQQSALSVRAGIAGVLTDVPHQVREHVIAGTTLAKVVQPDQLSVVEGCRNAGAGHSGRPTRGDRHA